jgi:hypothetical protein
MRTPQVAESFESFPSGTRVPRRRSRGKKRPWAGFSALLSSAAAATALAAAPAIAQAAPSVRVHVQAPVDLQSPEKTTLHALEHYGKMPLWQHTFEIPYEAIRAQIQKEMNARTKKPIEGKETCTDPCPDVTWSVKLSPSFTFTKKNQPVLKQRGDSGNAMVRGTLDTQFRVKVHVDIHASTWADSVDIPIDIFVLIGAHAKLDMRLWPNIEVQDLDLEFTLDDSNVDLHLSGGAVALGITYGSLIGGTPLGILGGGPLALSSLGALFGKAAAEAAEAIIIHHIDQRIGKMLEDAHSQVQTLVQSKLSPALAKANHVKDDFFATKLPGVNKSFSELKQAFGMSVELHTVTPGGGLAASAVLRMDGKASDGRLKGELRIPAHRCVYATGGGFLAGMRLPVGLEPTNEQLQSKIGQACSQAVSNQAVRRKLYLGANPKVALGAAAVSRKTWKSSAGLLSYEGALGKTSDGYTCDFEVTNLPNAAFVELESPSAVGKDLTLRADVSKWLVTRVGNQTLTFDDGFKPVPKAVLGGETTCDEADGSTSGLVLTPSKLKELADWIENCPHCGRRIEKTGEVIYQIQKPEAFAKTGVGAEVSRAAQRARSGNTRRGTATPRQRAPAVNQARIPGARVSPAGRR